MDFLENSLFLILPPAMTVNPLKTIYLINGDLEETHHLQPKDFYSNPMERSRPLLPLTLKTTKVLIKSGFVLRMSNNQSVEGNFTLSLIDLFEDFDGDGTEDHLDSDDDGDGFSDSVEIAYGSDPRDPNSLANAAPDSLELNGSTLLENSPIDTQVGEFIATDPDSNSSLTLSLVDGNGSQHNQLFEIHQNQILHSLHSLDYETNATTYSVRIRVTDPYAASLERTFSISLLNEVEDLDGDQIEDFYDSDDDGDGFSDSVEIAYGSDPRNPNSLANVRSRLT